MPIERWLLLNKGKKLSQLVQPCNVKMILCSTAGFVTGIALAMLWVNVQSYVGFFSFPFLLTRALCFMLILNT